MFVLPFFGKNRFEKHKTGLFDDLRSTILENTNFTVSEQIQQFCLFVCFLLSSQSQLSKTGDDKDVPFNSWAGTRSSQSHISKWRLL